MTKEKESLPSLDDKHFNDLKTLLAQMHNIDLNSVLIEFDKEGRMHVTGKRIDVRV